ncbi:MAG: sorbosone dehydrogenase family protein, partial [Flavobacteriia bacterium]
MKIYDLTFRSITICALSLAVLSCNGKKEEATEEAKEEEAYQGSLPLDRLHLPEGFKIDVYAEGLDGARSMAMGDDGTLFVGTRNEGVVYAVKDTDGDYRADKT